MHIWRFRISACVLCLLGLIGCTERWHKQGASEAEFEVIKSMCSSHSLNRFPPNYRQLQIGGGYTNAMNTNCRKFENSVNCTTTGGEYVQPQMLTLDDNSLPREQHYRQCLIGNGWHPVRESAI